jgi:uncharacterized protein
MQTEEKPGSTSDSRVGGRSCGFMLVSLTNSMTGPPYHAITVTFRKEGVCGATVLRGVRGYGSISHYHTDNIPRLSQDLPIMIEAVKYTERIEKLLPRLDEMVDGGMITLEKARAILCRCKKDVKK